MSWDEGQTLTTRWDHAAAAAYDLHRHWKRGTSYSGFAQALARETPRLIEPIAERFRRVMRALPEKAWRCGGWVAFAIDGSRLEAPRTAVNETVLGCAGRERTGPQVFVTTVWQLGLGLPWDFRVGPGTDSERHHAAAMVDDLPPHALVVADAGFIGYDFCRRLVRSSRSFLLRVGGNIRLLEQLGYYEREGSDTVYLWPKKRQLNGRDQPLVLRLIRLKRGKQVVYLVTNVLDRRQLTETQAWRLYAARWGEEVFYRSLKQTLDRRKLLSRTPATCLAEAAWTLLGVWLLGLLTVPRIVARRGHPRRYSVARARDLVRQALRDERPRRGPRGRLGQLLGQALLDRYRRKFKKASRDYPRKKQEKPPGPPKIEPASPLEVERASRLVPPNIPKQWTA